jgi:beta-galactosidase
MVAVEVYRYNSGSYLEDQDMWRLSGIFRNVGIWSAPQQHVRDFFVKTDLDGQYRDANVEITAKLKIMDQSTKASSFAATLYDGDKPVSSALAESMVPP